MSIQITVKAAGPISISFEDIKKGTVYKLENGVVLWKIDKDNAVILQGCDGCNYLAMADSFKDSSAIKILGQVQEIVVE